MREKRIIERTKKRKAYVGKVSGSALNVSDINQIAEQIRIKASEFGIEIPSVNTNCLKDESTSMTRITNFSRTITGRKPETMSMRLRAIDYSK